MNTAIADLAASIRDSSMNAARQGDPPTARPARAAADAPGQFKEQPTDAEQQPPRAEEQLAGPLAGAEQPSRAEEQATPQAGAGGRSGGK
eukprot:8595866-Pyramimonas_sp.AAC.1